MSDEDFTRPGSTPSANPKHLPRGYWQHDDARDHLTTLGVGKYRALERMVLWGSATVGAAVTVGVFLLVSSMPTAPDRTEDIVWFSVLLVAASASVTGAVSLSSGLVLRSVSRRFTSKRLVHVLAFSVGAFIGGTFTYAVLASGLTVGVWYYLLSGAIPALAMGILVAILTLIQSRALAAARNHAAQANR